MNVLVVEDDPRIASFLVKGLRAEGYATSGATTADEALATVQSASSGLDLVLLDLGLPDMDGRLLLDTLRREWPLLPVIILTARDDLQSKIRGLDAGASDYVTKPFHLDELLARVRAALRVRDQAAANRLVVAGLEADLLTKTAWRAGQRIDLAHREWTLLVYFMRHPRQVLSRERILNHVWELDFDPGSNVVDVYVGYLRRKINLPGVPLLLETVRGFGYRLVPPGLPD